MVVGGGGGGGSSGSDGRERERERERERGPRWWGGGRGAVCQLLLSWFLFEQDQTKVGHTEV